MIELKASVPTINLAWWESSKREIAKVLQFHNEASWMSERDPNTGAKWQPRKEPTGSWPILRRTGRMQDKVKVRPSSTVGIFSTKTVSYGPFHMTGTERMVARPWLGVPDSSLRPIASVIAKHIFRNRR